MVAVGMGAAAPGAASLASGRADTASTGTLSLAASLRMESRADVCPPGTPSTVECFVRQGTGVVPGLGSVSESYRYFADQAFPTCQQGTVRILETTARFAVAGKGELALSVAAADECLSSAAGIRSTQSFTVTGGTGVYSGASGSGNVKHAASFTNAGAAGTDLWTGTLVVPGLEFDVTPPTITGAIGRTLRASRGAKRVRVGYVVNARDGVDGPGPVACRPKSRSWFAIGRTVVICSATDTSGNTRTAKFVITVRRHHP
jgi:hypothetical protein